MVVEGGGFVQKSGLLNNCYSKNCDDKSAAMKPKNGKPVGRKEPRKTQRNGITADDWWNPRPKDYETERLLLFQCGCGFFAYKLDGQGWDVTYQNCAKNEKHPDPLGGVVVPTIASATRWAKEEITTTHPLKLPKLGEPPQDQNETLKKTNC